MSEELKTSRFKKSVKIGVLVAIRSDESFDRYTVLKQGDYNTGRYGSQYDCGVFSPFMDLSTEDLWKITTLLDIDSNEIYSMYWDAGVPLSDQRIGSPVNVHAKDSVKLFKVLNPGTYSKMVGRLAGVDFVSAYGGVFNNGFKYIKLEQPKPFYQGVILSDTLVDAINYLGLPYTIRDINEKFGSEKTSTVHYADKEPVKSGMNITLATIQEEFVRKQAADKAFKEGEHELFQKFFNAIPKPKTWYDYTKQLVNEAEPMYQKGWMPKIETSIKHWARKGSAVNETTIFAWEVISQRKDKKFGADYPEDYQRYVDWDSVGYADVSRKPILKLFRYQQDCGENIASSYVKDIISMWDEGGKEEFLANTPLVKFVFEGGVIPRVPKPVILFDTAPSSGEIRNSILKDIDWNNGRIDNTGTAKMIASDTSELTKAAEGCPKTTTVTVKGEEITVADALLLDCLKEVVRRTLHDNVRDGGGSWKRTTIMALRNDIKGTYMGFSQNSEEKMIRANAEAAFATNEEERKKKIAEFEQLKAKVEKEKEKND